MTELRLRAGLCEAVLCARTLRFRKRRRERVLCDSRLSMAGSSSILVRLTDFLFDLRCVAFADAVVEYRFSVWCLMKLPLSLRFTLRAVLDVMRLPEMVGTFGDRRTLQYVEVCSGLANINEGCAFMLLLQRVAVFA